MRSARVIMALLIALSVALLPTAGSTMPVVGSTAQADVAHDMVMPSDMQGAMHDCCPDHAKTKPGKQHGDQCPMAFCCAAFVSIASPAGFHFDFPILAGNLLLPPADQVVALHSGSPPFRPPRV